MPNEEQVPVGGATPIESRILGPQGAAMIEQTAVQLGIFCTDCGLPMSGAGFEFISLRAVMKAGRPTVIHERRFVCHREECAEAREHARRRATAYRPAGGWDVIEASAEGEVDEPQD